MVGGQLGGDLDLSLQVTTWFLRQHWVKISLIMSSAPIIQT